MQVVFSSLLWRQSSTVYRRPRMPRPALRPGSWLRVTSVFLYVSAPARVIMNDFPVKTCAVAVNRCADFPGFDPRIA